MRWHDRFATESSKVRLRINNEAAKAPGYHQHETAEVAEVVGQKQPQ